MSSYSEVGDMYEIPGEMCFQWEIRNFFSLPEDGVYRSPVFAFAHSCWNLRLFPTGVTFNESKEWISVYIEKNDSILPMTFDWKLGIVGSTGLHDIQQCSNVVESMMGSSKFYSRSEMETLKSELVPLGTLTISCKLRIHIKKSTKASFFTRLWNCSRDLKTMLDEEDKRDFSFRLSDDYELSAHKVILESRCDYFKIMFCNDGENKAGSLDLSHIEKMVFRNVLSYLYSGDVEELDSKTAPAIYTVARELQIEELKQLCTEYMKRSMSVHTICDILIFAGKYEEEEELKEYSIKFLAQNNETIFKTDVWKEFSEENPVIVSRLLQNVLEKMKLIET